MNKITLRPELRRLDICQYTYMNIQHHVTDQGMCTRTSTHVGQEMLGSHGEICCYWTSTLYLPMCLGEALSEQLAKPQSCFRRKPVLHLCSTRRHCRLESHGCDDHIRGLLLRWNLFRRATEQVNRSRLRDWTRQLCASGKLACSEAQR